MVSKRWEEKSLKYLGCGAQKGDRPVRRTGGGRFTRLRDGYNRGTLPYGRDVGRAEGEVEEIPQVRNARGAQVTEMVDGELVRAGGRGSARGCYSCTD